jgi:prepilin peptidase CpaA
MMSQGLALLLSATVIGGGAWAVREDLLFHRISNRLTGSLLCVGLAIRMSDSAWNGLEQSLLGVLVGLGCLLPFYIARAMGAGDVKLLAATGALLGPYHTWIAGLCTLLIGAVLAVMYVAGGVIVAVAHAPAGTSWTMRIAHAHMRIQELRRERMPYALAIALGCLAAISQSGELTQALNLVWGAGA